MFNAICGDNRHMLTVNAGRFEDENKRFVYTFSKGSVDDNGNKVKGESLKIPFKDRLTSPKLAEVAEFKKFIFDLEKPNRRYKLEKAAEKVKEGTSLTDEELKELGIESEADINDALEKSNKKRHEFISEWDFAEFIKKVIDSGKYSDKKFYIKGNANYSYSDNKKQVYESYVPQRIYLADDDADEYSTGTIKMIFNKDSLDDMSVEEKSKYYVNGYMFEYDNNRKSNIPVPITLTIPVAADDADDKTKKRVEAIKHKFMVDDDTYKELGVEIPVAPRERYVRIYVVICSYHVHECVEPFTFRELLYPCLDSVDEPRARIHRILPAHMGKVDDKGRVVFQYGFPGGRISILPGIDGIDALEALVIAVGDYGNPVTHGKIIEISDLGQFLPVLRPGIEA